jgi:hypothetical protein
MTSKPNEVIRVMLEKGRSLIAVCMLVALELDRSAHASGAGGPACVAIGRSVTEFRPSQPPGDLGEVQKKNIRYFVDEQVRLNAGVGKRLYLLRMPRFTDDPDHQFSIIFKERHCKDRCFGFVIIPADGKRDIIRISRRKNYITIPYTATIPRDGHRHPRKSISAVFMDEHEQYLISFFDALLTYGGTDLTGRNPPSEVIRSEMAVHATADELAAQSKFEGYFACIKSMFEVDDAIPEYGSR